MKITRESMWTGAPNEMDIDITEEQYLRWKKGELIQNVAPHLTQDEREFLISGMTPEEWNDMFDVEEEID